MILNRSSPRQTRALEVLDRNMQNVSREITAIVGRIEEDVLVISSRVIYRIRMIIAIV